MSTAVLDQSPIEVRLIWRPGDPVSLSITVQSLDWSGDHTATLSRAGESDVEMGVTATLEGSDTVFTFTLDAEDSDLGERWRFACRNTDGLTRFAGEYTPA